LLPSLNSGQIVLPRHDWLVAQIMLRGLFDLWAA
jgi:hypothetical protein